jgi:hypothetical protein
LRAWHYIEKYLVALSYKLETTKGRVMEEWPNILLVFFFMVHMKAVEYRIWSPCFFQHSEEKLLLHSYSFFFILLHSSSFFFTGAHQQAQA